MQNQKKHDAVNLVQITVNPQTQVPALYFSNITLGRRLYQRGATQRWGIILKGGAYIFKPIQAGCVTLKVQCQFRKREFEHILQLKSLSKNVLCEIVSSFITISHRSCFILPNPQSFPFFLFRLSSTKLFFVHLMSIIPNSNYRWRRENLRLKNSRRVHLNEQSKFVQILNIQIKLINDCS